MRGRIALTLAALAVAGCGGSSGPSAQSPTVALRSWYRAIHDGDARTACELLTSHGRRAVRIESMKACSVRYASPPHHRLPDIGPVGVSGDVALALTESKRFSGDNVVVLRRIGGQWRVDLISTPVLASLDARGVPPIQRESLPSGGAQRQSVLGAAGRSVDKLAAEGGEAVHVATAAVVGDVAIAYLLPGSDVPGARPTSTTYGGVFLTRGASGWRVFGGTTFFRPRPGPS